MKKIRVMSVGEIQNFITANEYAIISFRDAEEFNIQEMQKFSLAFNEHLKHHENILFIEANDVEVTSYLKFKLWFKRSGIPIKLFNKHQAKEIIEFADKNKDKDLIIQCVYGKSRSLTTAIFLEETILNKTHQLEHDERVIRNNSVYELLNTAFIDKTAQ